MNVVVVRDGGKCENARWPSTRQRFQILRDTVYARRGLRRYGLQWVGVRSPLTGIVNLRLDAGHIRARVRDAGVMSFCTVTVDDHEVPTRYAEEGFAGHGGVAICMLRATQHVLALIEERVAAAHSALDQREP